MGISLRQLAPALLILITGCDLKLPLADGSETQTSDSPPIERTNPDVVCRDIAETGLDIMVNIPPLADARVSVEFSKNKRTEKLESFAVSEGYRIMENGVLKLGHRIPFSGANGVSGKVNVNFLVNGVSQEQRIVTIPVIEGGCHYPITQSLTFTVTPNYAWDPNPAMDYYPVTGGRLVLIERATGVARVSGENLSYASTEIIKLVGIETNDGQVASYGVQLEKQPSMATSLGQFFESGIDRGPLLNPNSKDTGVRELLAR